VSLRTALAGRQELPPKPSVEDSLEWLKSELWSLPVLDQCTGDELLGYNEHGHFD